MPDCPARVLPPLSDLRLWLPLLLFILVVLAVLLALGGWIALYRLERQTAHMMRTQDGLRAAHVPELTDASQAQEAAFDARLALLLAGQPRWWHRFTRRAS